MDPRMILGLQGAGTALEVGGILMQGSAEKKAANYNADVLEMNARQASNEATLASEKSRQDAAFQLGRQRAAIAQSGGGFGGSALDVQRQSETMSELDAMNIRYGGELKKRGLMAEANMSRWQGKVAKKASYLKATSALISGGADYGKTALMLGG